MRRCDRSSVSESREHRLESGPCRKGDGADLALASDGSGQINQGPDGGGHRSVVVDQDIAVIEKHLVTAKAGTQWRTQSVPAVDGSAVHLRWVVQCSVHPGRGETVGDGTPGEDRSECGQPFRNAEWQVRDEEALVETDDFAIESRGAEFGERQMPGEKNGGKAHPARMADARNPQIARSGSVEGSAADVISRSRRATPCGRRAPPEPG